MNDMATPFRIGIAGLGTVGAGVLDIFQNRPDLLARRAGRPVEVAAVSARDRGKDRGVDISGYDWVDNPVDLASHPGLDAVVELIGGSDGPAHDLVQAALGADRFVVTANKALLAHHGFSLATLADEKGAALRYEAAVAGGIPVIKALREGLAANTVRAVYGILNGTCNYILTEMRRTGQDFETVLKAAQDKGYAEADPAFDVDGVDAAHKICILAALAFGVRPDFEAVRVQGIRHIQSLDIRTAEDLGYRIKLLGMAREDDGRLSVSVQPWLVPVRRPLAAVDGVYNAVSIDCDAAGQALLTGRGAGAGPTASAVVADILDLARGHHVPVFGVPAARLAKPVPANPDSVRARYYMRLTVLDQAGVLADISAILRDHNISVESLVQRGRDPDQPVSVVILTHEAQNGDIDAAVSLIESLTACTAAPCVMGIAAGL